MTGSGLRLSGLTFTAALILGVLSVTGPVWVGAQESIDTEIETNRRQLDELKREAEATRRKVREFRAKEEGVLERLNQAEQAIDATRAYMRKLDSREAELDEEIRNNEGRLNVAKSVLGERRQALRKRLRFTYMYGRARSLEVMFSANSFPDLMRRTAFLGRILRQDEELVHKVEDQETEVNGRLATLHDKHREVDALQAEKESEQAEYEKLKEERARSLAKVRGEREANERSVRELERAAQAMEGVLAELERQRQERRRQQTHPDLDELDRLDFSRNKGRLPWPATGKIITQFGRHEHPKYKTVTVSNGVDIAARMGSGVFSVGDGVVDLVQWLPGYGQTVILNHGRGFYTIYGHLSAVAVAAGARVNPGDRLGAVGDTGSLKGACLHFELREGGEARDPMNWLR